MAFGPSRGGPPGAARCCLADYHCCHFIPCYIYCTADPMRVSSVLLSLATIAALSTFAAGVSCDTEQNEQYDALTDSPHMRCIHVLGEFDACDNICRAKLQKVATNAPDCSIRATGDQTVKSLAESMAKKCDAVRANATTAYTPQRTPGAANCTGAQQNDWTQKFSYGSTYYQCVEVGFRTNKTCSSDCLKAIEESVRDAPPCLAHGDFSLREFKKAPLVKCLKARGDDLKSNAVLQSGSGTPSGGKSASSSSSPSSPASSSSAAGVSVVALPTTIVLVSSAVLTMLSLV